MKRSRTRPWLAALSGLIFGAALPAAHAWTNSGWYDNNQRIVWADVASIRPGANQLFFGGGDVFVVCYGIPVVTRHQWAETRSSLAVPQVLVSQTGSTDYYVYPSWNFQGSVGYSPNFQFLTRPKYGETTSIDTTYNPQSYAGNSLAANYIDVAGSGNRYSPIWYWLEPVSSTTDDTHYRGTEAFGGQWFGCVCHC